MGRALQLLGLSTPVAAIFLQLGNVISLGQLLVAAVSALAAFYLGRLLEGYARG